VRTLHHPFSMANRVLQVGANAGVAVSGLHGNSPEKLLAEAERATFEARKRPGKGTFLAPPRPLARVLRAGRDKALVPATGSRRVGDPKDWSGPRSER
jgi:predicted signal transduction protein with EAL and GGDEF domain